MNPIEINPRRKVHPASNILSGQTWMERRCGNEGRKEGRKGEGIAVAGKLYQKWAKGVLPQQGGQTQFVLCREFEIIIVKLEVENVHDI